MPSRYLKLAALYFFYFASFGIYLPYWAPYLQSLGFSATRIGELLAIFLATKIFAPYVWGWVADRTGRHLGMLRLAAALTVLFYALLLLHGGSYVWLAVTIFLYTFFFNAWLPQLESITLGRLGHMSHHYGKIRLWGSIGFIVCTLGAVPIVEHHGLGVVPYLMFGMIILVWLASLFYSDQRQRAPADRRARSILPALLRPEVLFLVALCFVIQLGHSTYYAFFSIYMEDMGYGRAAIGWLWSLGVVAEILIFMVIPGILSTWKAPALLTASMIITALRWFLTASFPQQLAVILFAQTLHAVSFGVYHAAAIELVNRWFPGSLHARGQALYLGVSFGLGGGVGMLLSGYLWDRMEGSTVFLLAGLITFAGALLTIPLYRRPASPGERSSRGGAF